MGDTEDKVILPEGNGKFTKPEGDNKNYTRLSFDDKHNAEFIKEMREKINKCDSAGEEELKRSFKAMTGINFDDIRFNEETEEIYIPDTVIPDKIEIVSKEDENGAIIFEAKDSAVPGEESVDTIEIDASGHSNDAKPDSVGISKDVPEETVSKDSLDKFTDATLALSQDFDSSEDREYTEEVLSQVDKYMADPKSLKFSEADMEGMAKIGIMDYATVKDMCSLINNELDEIAAGIDDPESKYSNEDERRKAITNTIAIKVDTEKVIQAGEELMDPETVARVYNHKYPLLKTKGTAFILDDFANYLDERIKADRQFLAKEMNNRKKIDKIFDHVQEYVFKYMKTEKGNEYKIGQFVMLVYEWNKKRISDLTGIALEEMSIKKFDSILVIFTALFMRFIYKHVVPDFKSKSLQKRLFFQFFIENADPSKVPIEKVEEILDASWKSVWEKCPLISIDCRNDYNSTQAARNQTSRK